MRCLHSNSSHSWGVHGEPYLDSFGHYRAAARMAVRMMESRGQRTLAHFVVDRFPPSCYPFPPFALAFFSPQLACRSPKAGTSPLLPPRFSRCFTRPGKGCRARSHRPCPAGRGARSHPRTARRRRSSRSPRPPPARGTASWTAWVERALEAPKSLRRLGAHLLVSL